MTPSTRIRIDEHQNIDVIAALKYLIGILSSTVYEFATRLQLVEILSSTPEPNLQIKIWLKREDLQPIVSIVRDLGLNLLN